MSEHTQGPWEARGENGKYRVTDWDVRNDELGYYATVPVHRNGYVVAMVVDGDGDDELLDANARLIAAAPELLAALIQVLGEYKGVINPDGNRPEFDDYAEVIAARAAIAKATAHQQANRRETT